MKYFFLISISLLLLNCKKKTDLVVESIEIDTQQTLRSVKFINDKYYIVGGNKLKNGFVYSTADFQNIIKEDVVTPYAIYDIQNFDDHFVLTSDSAKIYYSDNLSTFKEHYYIEKDWIQMINKQPLRRIYIAENGSRHIVGGGYLQYGVYYSSIDDFQRWQPLQYHNELRAIYSIGDNMWKAGFGILLKSNDSGKTWEKIDHQGSFFTDVWFKNENEGVFCTFDGKIYTTQDGGVTLNKSYVDKKVSMTGVEGFSRIKTNSRGEIAVAGGGDFVCSKDNGKSWQSYNLNITQVINDFVFYRDDELIVIGNDGLIAKVILN